MEKALASGYFSWSCFFVIHAIAFLFFFSATFAIRSGNDTDRIALLEFKNKIIGDPFGVMSLWNDSIHFCQWYGVKCSRRHQRITVLDLNSLKFEGTISPHLGNLSFLRVLDLENNSFSHIIPPELGRLRRLQTLYLYNNSLTGEIPSNLSRCSELLYLSLFNNKLTGRVPPELGSLSKLQFLSISINNLTGNIPPSLGNLSSLEMLSAGINNFIGQIPETLGQLRNLTLLGLLLNQLSGTVPSSIFNLSSIEILDIALNQIEGYLPPDLFMSFPNLRDLSFGSNQFTGPIPSSISNVTNLATLQLDDNKLTGKVPTLERLDVGTLLISMNDLGNGELDDLKFLCSLSNASSLVLLAMGSNNFGGLLHECIGNLSANLRVLSLNHIRISGRLPDSIGNLVNLQRMWLHRNKFSGIIPQSIGNLQGLVEVSFYQNMFFGPIPSSLGNLTKLNRLFSADNNLQGTIPSSLANCKNLQILDFSRNNLSGSLPPEVLGLSSLSIYLSFSENNLTGSLPKEIGNLKALGILDVSKNMLSGEIPSDLGSCIRLEYLYMQRNHFQGSLPSSLRSLRGLVVLDLSHNNLSGPIPEYLATFRSLLNLFLAFNDFEGMVPTDGVLKNSTIITVKGNSKLCGRVPEFQLPPCNFKRPEKRRTKVIIATIAGISGAVLVFLAIPLLLWLRKKNQRPGASSYSENSLLNVPMVTYRDLHKATDGFSSANLIGFGSFGSVYKGILHEGGLMVAVKVLNLQHHGAAKSFMAECEALRNIRHRNLVKVLTACSSTDSQGNDFKALVCEFMANGNLEDLLHPSSAVGDNHEQTKNLSIIKRVNVAVDVASAIEYLHQDSGTPLVHCDLKPSNVLLDEEMTACIGDFGLAKFLSDRIQDNSSNQASSAGFRGTIGYAPPEYGLGSEPSINGDVYSYGILLLEVFTGKRPTNHMFKEGWSLHEHAKSALPDGVMEILDPILLQETGEIEAAAANFPHNPRSKIITETVVECLISIIEIGVSRSVESPGERMNIKDVGSKLCSIRSKLVGIHLHPPAIRNKSTFASAGQKVDDK